MKKSFLNREKPWLTLLFQENSAESAIETIKRGIEDGAEAFGIQTESLRQEDRNPESYRKIFAAAGERPIYVTNYRYHSNENVPDDVLAEGLLELADCGATLCDVMGDMFCPTPGEMTDDPAAVEKQCRLVERLHSAGAEVLMSSHVQKYISAGEVLNIALRQQERGVDVAKIVTGADTMEQQIDNLRTTNLLKETLHIPYLFLSGGRCEIHRRIGPMLGCCMYLCALDENTELKPVQPILRKIREIRNYW